MVLIANKFGVVYPYNHPEIKEIDSYMVHLEWDKLMETNDMSFKCLTAIQAKKEFLRVYNELSK